MLFLALYASLLETGVRALGLWGRGKHVPGTGQPAGDLTGEEECVPRYRKLAMDPQLQCSGKCVLYPPPPSRPGGQGRSCVL